MEICLGAGSVAAILRSQVKETVAQCKADELRLKGALACLKGFIKSVEEREWYVTVRGKGTRVDQAIYQPAYETAIATLPKIQDVQLIQEAERVLEKANRCVEKIVGQYAGVKRVQNLAEKRLEKVSVWAKLGVKIFFLLL